MIKCKFCDLQLFTQLLTASSDLWCQCFLEDHLVGGEKRIINGSGKTGSAFPRISSAQTDTIQTALLNGSLLKSEVSFKPLYSNQLWGRQCSAVPSLALQRLPPRKSSSLTENNLLLMSFSRSPIILLWWEAGG